jgi:hypothetical protein
LSKVFVVEQSVCCLAKCFVLSKACVDKQSVC